MSDSVQLSPYNVSVLRNRAITINDCTLREGEQACDVAFSRAEKVKIAAALRLARLPRIQIGTAEDAGLDELADTVRPVPSEVLVLGFKETWKSQIDRAAAAGVSGVNIACRSSDRLLKLLGWTRDEFLARSVESVTYAVDKGLSVTYSPTDGTRANWSTLAAAYEQSTVRGAELVYVLDTVGVAAPSALTDLVGRLRELVAVPIGVHVHNDFGLALANVVAACEAGATWVDTSVNGLGDRCGNPALDEVVAALELLYGARTGVDLTKMTALSHLVAELSGVPLASNKPVVGPTAFVQKSEIHVEAALRDPLAYQPFLPELVGNHSEVAVGKHTGPVGLAHRLERLGIATRHSELARIQEMCAALAVERKRSLTDDELRSLAASAIREPAGTP